MKIEQPVSGKDIYICYDFLEPEDLRLLIEYTSSTLFFSEHVSHEERLALGHIPKFDDKFLDNEFYQAFARTKELMKSAIIETFPDLDIVHFKTYHGISVRTPEGGSLEGKMMPHVDGPAEIDSPDHGIKNIGSLLYLNDNYRGGEIYYPKLNWEYKPVANSFVMHRGEDDYLHGVNEIFDGWRLNIGGFAFEYYPEFDESFVYDHDKRD